jgi:hypothetical protein
MGSLDARDRELIWRCLREALDPRYFPDWEFPVLMPFTRDELRQFVESSPDLDNLEHGSGAGRFVGAVLNNLIRYPHGQASHLQHQVGCTVSDLESLSGRAFRASPLSRSVLRARVEGGRIILNEPTSLPEGTELVLAVIDLEDEMSDADNSTSRP